MTCSSWKSRPPGFGFSCFSWPVGKYGPHATDFTVCKGPVEYSDTLLKCAGTEGTGLAGSWGTSNGWESLIWRSFNVLHIGSGILYFSHILWHLWWSRSNPCHLSVHLRFIQFLNQKTWKRWCPRSSTPCHTSMLLAAQKARMPAHKAAMVLSSTAMALKSSSL